MNDAISLSRREVELIVEELDELLIPARLQRVFEAETGPLVLQFRAPGVTHHLLISAEDNDVRLHLVDSKPTQPDHPSPFTMQLRKWLHGAWLENISVSDADRIVYLELDAIEPDWEPTADDEEAPRRRLILVAELLGRHPNFFLLDADRRIITAGPGRVLGDRSTEPESPYEDPPPPPEWAEQDQVRPLLCGLAADGSRSAALAEHLAQSLQERRRRNLRQTLESELDDQYERLDRRIGHIESDLERIDDAEQYRRHGELLQSAYGDVDPGQDSVAVPDFYQDGMPEVEIPLDPAKDLQQNIDDYFHEYRRLTEARDKVEKRLLESIEQRDRIERARRELEDVEGIEDLRTFRTELQNEGILSKPPADDDRVRRRDEKGLPPYREFHATSGSRILVGRNAKKNDELTTTVARGRDMWLHARNFPGAHVVLRMRKDEELKSEDLIDAATLAAHFSEGRRDTTVDITYTEAKYIRKPKGAPPGSVSVGGGSTITVRLEDERLQRLLDTERDFRQ